MKLKFTADPHELAAMRAAARGYLLESGIPEMDAELMVLALDEACTNIIRYAYGGCSQHPIRLHIQRMRGSVRCTLRDYGNPCDPSKIHGRDLTDFRPGGLGVRIMHAAFDTVDFQPMPRGTRLTLTRSLRGHSRPVSAAT